MKKIENIMLTLFAIGVILVVFAGGLSLLGYVVAMFIGGTTAEAMCLFIFKTYFPWVIKIASVSIGLGLLGMYFGKKKALSMEKKKN